MANNNLIFSDEPPQLGAWRRDREQISHHNLAAEARKNPDKWLRIPKSYKSANGASSLAYAARSGRISAYRHGFEILARADDEGYWVWIKYTGEVKSDE